MRKFIELITSDNNRYTKNLGSFVLLKQDQIYFTD